MSEKMTPEMHRSNCDLLTYCKENQHNYTEDELKDRIAACWEKLEKYDSKLCAYELMLGLKKTQPKFEPYDDVLIKNKAGYIYEVHETCPESNKWLSKMEKPVKASAVRKPWYSVIMRANCEMVLVPEHRIMPL